MSTLLRGYVISLLFICLIHSPLFAFRTACAAASLFRAYLVHWFCAFFIRALPSRRRFAPSFLQRSLCATLILVMAINPVMASPEVSHSLTGAVSAMAINSGQSLGFWWHSSGWAEKSARFAREYFPFLRSTTQQQPGWDGIGAPNQPMPAPKPQETQAQRNARVAKLEIFPKDITLRRGEPVAFMVAGYDIKNNPIGSSFRVAWSGWNESTLEQVDAIETGNFSSTLDGSYRIRASLNGLVAETRVTVSGARLASMGQSVEQSVGTIVVSSRDLPQPPKSSSSTAPPPRTRDRIAKNLSSRFATRFAPAGIKAAPRLLPNGDCPYCFNSDNFTTADDPGKQRGNPTGHAPDGGAGSANFQIAAPVLGLDGRGLDLNLGMVYNSRLWHKANSDITFNIDGEAVPGWSLGFTRIVSMGGQNGYMLVEPDGTRRPYTCSLTLNTVSQEAKCKTMDGSFIDYRVLGDAPADGGAPRTAFVYLPNGTELIYVGATSNMNANYPVQIIDANGNRMLINYRNNKGPQIDSIADTLGRLIRFYYDSNNLLVAVTAPDQNPARPRTLLRITYDWKNLADLGGNYGFAGLTPKVRNNVIPVIKAIYYPATSTGFWFGDPDSYSNYGMLSKVIEQVGMGFSAAPLPADPNQAADPGTITPGAMSSQMVYDYPMAASGLGSEPTYQNMTETWADMDVAPAVTHYFVQENASPRRVEITRPDGAKTVMLSHNAPGQFNDGLIYQDESYSPQGALLGRSFVNWEMGDCAASGQPPGPYQYCSPRPSRIETTDERNQITGKELNYGPRYNQATETREYGYGYSFGGANTLLRKTVSQYLNDPNYNDPQPENDLVWHHIFNLVAVNEVYGGNGARLSRTEYSYDQFKGTAGLMDTPGVNYGGYEIGMSPYLNQPNYAIYDLDTRGNVTTTRSYADAATLDPATAVVDVRHYDITGNVRQVESSCCEVTTFNYTLNTQYAWPESQIRGSASDTAKQNKTEATYDFNTSLVMTETDANGRLSQNFYFDGSLRPRFNYAPTGAYTYLDYDEVRRIVFSMSYEAGKYGADIASRDDKYLDGEGRVRKEIAFGKNYVRDVVDTKYDQMGRVWQQTRPYRQNIETPQWSTVSYDSLDRPIETTAADNSKVTRQYNQGPDPAGSSGQPGQTMLVTDPWGRQRWARSDALGRMVEVGEPNPDGDGTLGAGAMFTNYSYDALERLTQVVQGVQTRTFRYDSLGRLTHQKMAEKAGTLNDSGQHVGAGQWSGVFSYDTRSNLIQSVDARGVKTYFVYNNDPLNRLQAAQYDKSGAPADLAANIPDAPNVSYAYMTAGDKMRVQNVSVSSGMGNQALSYDSEGRLSEVAQTFTGRESYPLVTSYLWDTLSRLKEETYPKQYGAGDIRKKIEPTYDVASRVDSLKFGGVIFASNPVYNAASQTTSLNVGSLVKELYNFDPKTGLLTSQSVVRGVDSLLNLQYNYTLTNDANNNGTKTGQLTGTTDLRNQARNRAYEYDKLGRLKKAKGGVNAFSGPAWDQSYAYDRYGNRTSVTKTGDAPQIPRDGLASLSYNTGANRITSAGFEYDPAGNQTRAVIDDSGAQQQYRYDAAGRLAQVLSGDGTIVLASYSYGASNQRLMSVEGGVTKYFALDGGQISAEYDAAGASGLQWKTSYVYLGGRLLATTSGSDGTETRFHHADRLGIRLATDAANGEEVTMQLTLPFGTMQPFGAFGGDNSWQHATKNNPSQKRFTSYDRSNATGLDYAQNRFYSSQQGRFTQVDPIEMNAASLGDPQTLNLYAYCGNDPINRTDPAGTSFFGKLFGFIGKAFKWIARVAAVVLAIAVVLAVTWGFGAAVAIKLGLAAFKFALDGWGNSKWTRLLSAGIGAYLGFNLGKLSRTPPIFPFDERRSSSGSWILAGVGAVYSFFQHQGGGKAKGKEHSSGDDTVMHKSVTIGEKCATIGEYSNEFGGKWKARNGKWYRTGWGGNGSTGPRSLALERAAAYKTLGKSLFFVGAGISGYEGYEAAMHGDIAGASKHGLDIGMGAVGAFCGPVGAGASGVYFGVDFLIGWDKVGDFFRLGGSPWNPRDPYSGP